MGGFMHLKLGGLATHPNILVTEIELQPICK